MNQAEHWFTSLATSLNDLLFQTYEAFSIFLNEDDIHYLKIVIRWCSFFRCPVLHLPWNSSAQQAYLSNLNKKSLFFKLIEDTIETRRTNTLYVKLQRQTFHTLIKEVIRHSKNLLDYVTHHSHTFRNREEMKTALNILQVTIHLECPLIHRTPTSTEIAVTTFSILHMRIWQIICRLFPGSLTTCQPHFITILEEDTSRITPNPALQCTPRQM